MKDTRMKNKLIKYAAILANLGMIVFALILITQSYSSEAFLAMFLLIPPILSITALYTGPDCEETRLAKQVRKASLRKELSALEEFDKK